LSTVGDGADGVSPTQAERNTTRATMAAQVNDVLRVMVSSMTQFDRFEAGSSIGDDPELTLNMVRDGP
ncbi:MAG: hypothetical protein ACRDXF_04505, partial [Acidimicrobiia bacterium]